MQTVIESTKYNDISSSSSWIIFDAPLKSTWTDKIITLVDDKSVSKLFLSNGDFIRPSKNTSFIVETDQLQLVSSCFLTRFNMIYIHAGWKWSNCLEFWIERMLPELKVNVPLYITCSFEKYAEAMQDFLGLHQKNLEFSASFQDALKLLECLIKSLPKTESIFQTLEFYDELILFSLLWSFGSKMDATAQYQFNVFFINLIKKWNSSGIIEIVKVDPSISLFELHFDSKQFKWRKWCSFDFPDAGSLTMRNKYKYFADILLRCDSNVLLRGNPGVRKTNSSMEVLLNLFKHNFLTHSESINRFTGIDRFLNLFQTVLSLDEKKEVYQPQNKKLCIFIDDLQNCSQKSESILEFLRFIFDNSGFWTKNKAFRNYCNLSFIANLDVNDTNRSGNISKRLRRHMFVFDIHEGDFINTEFIGHFRNRVPFHSNTAVIHSCFNAFLSLHQELKNRLSCTYAKQPGLFRFSIYDIERCMSGLLFMYSKISHKEHLSNL